MWTQFWDMHSGGGQKEKWARIYIEAPEDEACVIFYNRFGHSPHRVTCTCCGEDYSVSSHEKLEQLTGYHRQCNSIKPKKKGGLWDNNDPNLKNLYLEDGEEPPKGYSIDKAYKWSNKKYQTLKEYVKNDDVHVIYEHQIEDHERKGDLPQQGYVWVD